MPSIDLSQVSTEGLGLMNFTWRPDPVPQETAFEVMNEAIKLNLPKKTLFNGGEFYGPDCINLKLIQAFFEKYPAQREHVVISIKGAIDPKTHAPITNEKGINASIDNILKYIPDLDIFEPARLNPGIPIEETIAALDGVVDSGKIKAYTVSEVSVKSLETFAKTAKHKPVGVEVEFSLLTREIAEDGLAEIAGKYDIPIVAYSPLSRGLLAGAIKSVDDLKQGDLRSHFERFSPENLPKNLAIVEKLVEIAEKKGVTSAQLALAWIKFHSETTVNGVKFPKVIPIPSNSHITRLHENFKKVTLTDEEFAKLNETINGEHVAGHRYNQHAAGLLRV